MQYDKFIPSVTERFKAITLPQPLADDVAFGKKTHVVRKKGTEYRGDIIIVSSPSPKGERSGMMVGKGMLADVRGVRGGYLYTFKDVRRLIELPCQKCQMKGEVWDCYYTRDSVMEYPLINMRGIFGLPPIK